MEYIINLHGTGNTRETFRTEGQSPAGALKKAMGLARLGFKRSWVDTIHRIDIKRVRRSDIGSQRRGA